MMFCTKCGTKHDLDVNYCYSCGAPVKHELNEKEAGLERKDTGSLDEISREELALFIGEKSNWYFAKWGNAENPAKKRSWNTVGFFLPTFWLGYRKMYKTVAFIMAASCLLPVIDAFFATVPTHLYNVFSLTIAVSVGFWGNATYYKHAMDTIKSIKRNQSSMEAQKKEMVKKGGTSWGGVGLVVLLMVLYVLLTAGLDVIKE